jgi:hypothetical protein
MVTPSPTGGDGAVEEVCGVSLPAVAAAEASCVEWSSEPVLL